MVRHSLVWAKEGDRFLGPVYAGERVGDIASEEGATNNIQFMSMSVGEYNWLLAFSSKVYYYVYSFKDVYLYQERDNENKIDFWA